jgi:hypothetical protein
VEEKLRFAAKEKQLTHTKSKIVRFRPRQNAALPGDEEKEKYNIQRKKLAMGILT